VERTRIGSPYVIAAMQRAIAVGHERVVGWEANGGFLTGAPLRWGAGELAALPTRDAMLPLLCCLTESARRGCSLATLFGELPARRSRSGLLDAVAPEASRAALERLRPSDPNIVELRFDPDARVSARRAGAEDLAPLGPTKAAQDAVSLRDRIAHHFDELPTLGSIRWLNFVDGLRIGFSRGDVAHLRPSGNAPQFRIYALSDKIERASLIVELAVRERTGIIARLIADGAVAAR
jgi:phosphomannomutase